MASYQGNTINPKRFGRSQIKFLAFLIPLGAVMLLPIVFMFSQALKPLDELFLFPPTFLVRQPNTANLLSLFNIQDLTSIPVTKYLFNSIVVSAIVVVLSLVISAMSGYALSKMKFRLRGFLFEVNTIALMFVPAAVTIPRYLVIEKLGLINTYWGHILPILALPVGVFLVKQFVDQVPDELLEAATIDGAQNWAVFSRIVMPLIGPALATVAILTFQSVWNNAETSNLYMNKETLRTFAFYMTTLSSTTGNNVAGQGVAAAAALVMFIPNLLIFIGMQSKVMDTMAHSGLK